MSPTGEGIRLSRLFSESKNAVVVAVDHGLYFGPLAGMLDLPSVIDRVQQADAILMAPGMPAHCSSVFSRRGAPACIIRLNWGSNYAAMWKYRHSHSVPDAHNVEVFSSYVIQKRELGIPLVGEVHARTPWR